MRLVSAAELLPEAPDGLQAVRFLEREPTGPVRRLYAVGDIGCCGHLADLQRRDPWREVGPSLRAGDLVFGNLETPLVPFDPAEGRTPFVGRSGDAAALAGAGFGVLSLANNHIGDAGAAGILTTLEAVGGLGIATLGAGPDAASCRRLVVTDLDGLTVGWLGCARTLQAQADGAQFWELDAAELLASVHRHRAEVDVLVVSLHLGYMLVDYPHPDHRRLALELAAAGADLVLAHHPHVVQGIETTADRSGVCHSLGNFLFDWTVGEIPVEILVEEQRRGVILAADLDRRGVCRLAALPTRVDDEWVVRWQVGDAGRAQLERWMRISRDLEGDYGAAFHRQRAERNTGLALRSIVGCLRRGELRVVLDALRRVRPHHLAMAVRWLRRKVLR